MDKDNTRKTLTCTVAWLKTKTILETPTWLKTKTRNKLTWTVGRLGNIDHTKTLDKHLQESSKDKDKDKPRKHSHETWHGHQQR